MPQGWFQNRPNVRSNDIVFILRELGVQTQSKAIPFEVIMPDSTPPTWMKHALLLTLIISLIMLIILLLYVPLLCGQMAYATSGEYVCDLGTGWYIFTGVFLILTLYSVYNLNHFFCGWNYQLAHLFTK